MYYTPLKIIYFILGSISLGLGILGIVLPGLPTTPFLLLSAALYVKSSNRLYQWLLNHKIFGKIIREYRENKTIPAKQKYLALFMMASMITLSVFVFLENLYLRIAVLILGAVGAFVVISIPTARKDPERF
ncbi:MAG: YbaN family protein [Spirochaetia bacterium]|nr:YbaN family protein [Spirochaetia bacterium]